MNEKSSMFFSFTHLVLIRGQCYHHITKVLESQLLQPTLNSPLIHNSCSINLPRQDHCPVGIIHTEWNHNKPLPHWIPPHDFIFGCGNTGVQSKHPSHDLSLDRSSSSIPHVVDDIICGKEGACQTNVLRFLSFSLLWFTLVSHTKTKKKSCSSKSGQLSRWAA